MITYKEHQKSLNFIIVVPKNNSTFADVIKQTTKMTDLLTLYSSMPVLLQVFWGCAIVASIIFILQTVLTLVGIDHVDTDTDFDGGSTMDLGGGMNLFTIRNLMGFLIGFGWTGVCFWDAIDSTVLLTLLALVVGCLFVGIFVFIYRQTRKLEHNGAFNIKTILGQTADVYLRIPAEGEGKGKIQVSINGAVQEFDAVTDGAELIPTGRKVRITDIIDGETVRVTCDL